MAIRIKHDPVATPIIASFATGVGQAQERKRRDATRLLAEQQQMQWRTAMQFQGQQFEAQQRNADRNMRVDRDLWMAERDDARTAAGFAHDEDMFDRRDRAYRDKDEFDSLYSGIADREDFMRKNRLSDYGAKQMEEASKSLDWIRRNRDSVRPEVYRQYMSQWMSEFDSRNPGSWIAPEPSPVEALRNGTVFTADGRLTTADDILAGKEKAGTALIPNGRGGVQVAKIGGQDDGQQKMFEWAHSQAMKEFSSDENRTTPPDEKEVLESINRLTRIRESWMKQQGGGAPVAGDETAPPPATGDGATKTIGQPRQAPVASKGRELPPLLPSETGNAPLPGEPGAGPIFMPPQQAPAVAQQAPPEALSGSQYAVGVIQQMQQKYGDINDPKEITNAADRVLLEQAIKALEQTKKARG